MLITSTLAKIIGTILTIMLGGLLACLLSDTKNSLLSKIILAFSCGGCGALALFFFLLG